MIKDDCKRLTLKQVESLIATDGLGKSCEYDLDALKMRRIELLNKKAAQDVARANSYEIDIGKTFVKPFILPPPMPTMVKVERTSIGPADSVVHIPIVQPRSNLGYWLFHSILLHATLLMIFFI